MAQQLMFIKDVTPSTRSWSVKVRVEEKQMPRQSQSSPRRYQRLVLVDGLGKRVAGTIFDSDIDLFKQSFQIHDTYIISKAKVTLVDIKYRLFDNPFQWIINKTTAVRLEQNSIVPRSVLMPSYVPFAEFPKYIGTRQLIDIIAIVVDKLPQRAIKIDGRENTVQDFVIVNPEMRPCILTLWNDLAVNEGEVIKNSAETMPVIVATRLVVSSYHSVSLGSTASSSIILDPSIPEAHNLKAWRSNNHSQLALILKEQPHLLERAHAINLNHDQCLSIADAVKDNNLQKFTVFVKVRIQDLLQKFYYMSCQKCYAATVAEYNWEFHCIRCGQIVQAKPREKLSINIYDESGDLDVTIFGNLAATLFKINAFSTTYDCLCALSLKLIKLQGEQVQIEDIFQKLQHEEFLMKIYKKVHQAYDGLRVQYTVTHYSEKKLGHDSLTRTVSPLMVESMERTNYLQKSEQSHSASMPSKNKPLINNVALGTLNYDDRMFIADAIKDNDLQNFIVLVKVKILDSTQKCFYMACQECYVPTTNEYNVKFKCASCGKISEAKPREKLCINIYDDSGEMDITLFGDLAIPLLDMNAFACMEMSNEGHEIRIDNGKFENQLFLMKISKSFDEDSNQTIGHYICIACGRYQLQNIHMPFETTSSSSQMLTSVPAQVLAKGKQIADLDEIAFSSNDHIAAKNYRNVEISPSIPVMTNLQPDDTITYDKNNDDAFEDS